MTPRERNLAILTSLLLLMVGGYYGWNWYQTAIVLRQVKLHTAKNELAYQSALSRYYQGSRQLFEQWQARSLPDNKEASLNQYQTWLNQIANDSKLSIDKCTGKFSSDVKGFSKKYQFKLEATGSLEQVASLLEKFQQPQRLEGIRSLTIDPDEKSGKLNLVMDIECIGLTGTKNTSLPMPAVAPQVAEAGQGIVKAITDRNLFAAHIPPVIKRVEPPAPPPPPPPPPPAKFDLGKLTFVTAIIEANGQPEVWLNVRAQDRVLHLREGESFELDGQKGRIVKIAIDEQKVEMQWNNRTIKVANGKAISETRESREPRSISRNGE